MEWPADKVERRPLASLIPSARNARTHSDAQVAQIAASIREWGWTMPILVDEAGTIIAGHGRVLAAARLGLDAVPVMVARGWSDAQKRAYLIADNKLGLTDDDGVRVALTGFSERGLSALNASGNPGPTDPDAAPDTKAQSWAMPQTSRRRACVGDTRSAPAPTDSPATSFRSSKVSRAAGFKGMVSLRTS